MTHTADGRKLCAQAKLQIKAGYGRNGMTLASPSGNTACRVVTIGAVRARTLPGLSRAAR